MIWKYLKSIKFVDLIFFFLINILVGSLAEEIKISLKIFFFLPCFEMFAGLEQHIKPPCRQRTTMNNHILHALTQLVYCPTDQPTSHPNVCCWCCCWRRRRQPTTTLYRICLVIVVVFCSFRFFVFNNPAVVLLGCGWSLTTTASTTIVVRSSSSNETSERHTTVVLRQPAACLPACLVRRDRT